MKRKLLLIHILTITIISGCKSLDSQKYNEFQSFDACWQRAFDGARHYTVPVYQGQGIEYGIKKTSSTSIIERLEGAFYIANVKSKKATQILIKHLYDDDYKIRAYSAYLLGKICAVSAEVEIIKRFNTESEEEAKIWEMFARVKISNDKEARLFILTVLEGKPSFLVSDAVYALGEIGDDEAVKILTKNLERESVFLKYDIIRALGLTRNNKSIPILKLIRNRIDKTIKKNEEDLLLLTAVNKALEELELK